MAENRLSSTLKDSGFELYFDPECFRASMNWVIWTFYIFFLEK